MLITNFSSGELSGRLSGRADMPQYYQGAALIKNFDIIPTGGIERRNGTERIALLSGECRLIPFIIDKYTSIVIAAFPGKFRFYKNGVLMTSQGSALEVTVPYVSLSELREVQYAQNFDTMIFCQMNHAPFMLVYDTGAQSFTGAEMDFDFTPDVELDDDYSYIPDYGSTFPQGPTESGYCIVDGYLYVYDETNGWQRDDSVTEYDQEEGLFSETGKYPACCAFFNGRLFLAATGSARQKVWASASPSLSGSRYNQFATYTKYITVNKVVKDPDIHFFTADTDATKTVENSTTTWTGNRTLLKNVTQDLTGIENITDYYVTSDLTTTGTKVTAVTWDSQTGKGTITLSSPVIASGEAQVFSIQKWQERTTAGSSDYEFKVINNNMTRADNGFFFEVASDQNDAIKWLATANHLVIGTESSCFVMASGSDATSQTVVMNGRHGTDDLQATVVDRAVIYFSQGKRGIREFYWNNDEEAFRSNDIASLSPQMLSESPAVDFDFMTNPYARLIVTRYDGTLAVMLYEKNFGVMAWSRTELGDGEVRSCAVTRGDGGSDIVYLCVYHPAENGSGFYTLEVLDMMPETSGNGAAKIYLDSRSVFLSAAAAASAGYTAEAVIQNKTKDTVFTLGEYTEAGSQKKETLFSTGDTAYIGYTYESTVRSMPVVDEDPNGKKRITKLLVRFYDSSKPVLRVDGRSDELFSDFQEPFSGVKGITYPGTSERDVSFTLASQGVQPCTVLSVEAVLGS